MMRRLKVETWDRARFWHGAVLRDEVDSSSLLLSGEDILLIEIRRAPPQGKLAPVLISDRLQQNESLSRRG
eukprot:2305368-Pyramimonas_sp.AAC.1